MEELVMRMNNPLSGDLNHILNHTAGLWQEMRGKRIFITGGTGFFGCWFLESFAWANDNLDLNAKAVVLTRNYDAFQTKAPHLTSNPAIQFHGGDVKNYHFPDGKFSHIIHAAASTDVKLYDENPLHMYDAIVEGTRHTLDFAFHCNAQKFLLVSSGAVYGKQPSDMTNVPEDYCGAPDPTDVDSVYGEGKRVAELLCVLFAKKYNIETKIARCFAFVGPYLPLDIHYAVGNFIRDGLNGGPILVNGDGTPYRSYLYAADLAIWLWTILFKGESCCPYNVGSEDAVTIAELADNVARCFRKPVEIRIAKIPIQDKPAVRYVPSTKRVREILGLRESISRIHGIKRTILFHQGIAKTIEGHHTYYDKKTY